MPESPSSVALVIGSEDAAFAGIRQQFEEQIAFFRAKLNLPSARWDDIKAAMHDRSFIVAGAQQADLLNDLRAAVDKVTTGGSIGAFRKDFAAAVARSGWTGWTGEGTKAGEAWRTRVIYQTNISTSYAAGRWQQLNDPELLKVRPFWRYIHSDNVMSPRPQHKAWGDSGLTLPADHPFWRVHFPPNDFGRHNFGCHCRVMAVRAPGKDDAATPPDGWDAPDPKISAPIELNGGWFAAPGANARRPLQDFIDNKLINLDAPIGAAMWKALEPVLLQERASAWHKVFDTTLLKMQAGGNVVMVHTVAPEVVKALDDNQVLLENAAVWMRDTELVHALRDTKALRGAAIPESVWRDLPMQLQAATPYLDTQDKALIYFIDLGPRLGKIAVRINYNEKGRFGGVRARIVSNFIQTGGLVDQFNQAEARYVLLKK